MMTVGLCSTSDIITFDHNWNHRYLSSAGGKDLSNDAQIREMCTKMLRNLSEKLETKVPSTTLNYSIVKVPVSMMFFLKFSEASPVEGQSLAQKDKKRRKKKD